MKDEKVQRYIAEVIDNDDPDMEGKVQVYIEPFMHGWETDHYPWARAANGNAGGGSDEYGESNIPETGSLVWVWFENNTFKKHAFYESEVHLKKLHPHTLFMENVSSEIGSFGVYPNVKYKYYKNGVCIGVSSSDTFPEIFIYHPEGSYIYFDPFGSIEVESSSTLTIVQGGSELEMDDGTITIKGDLDVEGEVTANTLVPGASVSLSTHNHFSGLPGSKSSPPEPGT
jgi:hypothetical protein